MLPDGYDIRLGPGFAGVNLSVGQSHKIVLARLFFRDAPLMIGRRADLAYALGAERLNARCGRLVAASAPKARRGSVIPRRARFRSRSSP